MNQLGQATGDTLQGRSPGTRRLQTHAGERFTAGSGALRRASGRQPGHEQRGAGVQPYGECDRPRFTLQTDKRVSDEASAFAHP